MAAVQELEKSPIPATTSEPKLESPADAEKIVGQQEALRGVVTGTSSQTTAQTVTDDAGQPILTSTDSVVLDVVVPATPQELEEGSRQDVSESKRWWSVYWERFIEKMKKIGAKIVYKNKQISN